MMRGVGRLPQGWEMGMGEGRWLWERGDGHGNGEMVGMGQ